MFTNETCTNPLLSLEAEAETAGSVLPPKVYSGDLKSTGNNSAS